jgi:hypothetical protein
MSGSKRPSTSSLRRFITSRPYVTVAEVRRRFGLDDPDAMAHLQRNGTSAWVGLPEREATKLQELWNRDELGLELSVEVRAPVVVGIYPMRIARYVMDGAASNGSAHGNGNPHMNGTANANGSAPANGHASPSPQPPAVRGGGQAGDGYRPPQQREHSAFDQSGRAGNPG